MKTRFDGKMLAVIAALLAMALSANASASAGPGEREELATNAIATLERHGFVGSVLVARNHEIIFSGHYGLDSELHLVPSYWVASITKQFAAAAILLLQQRGQLDIHQTIVEYLPAVPDDKKYITVFQLLTHTSGISQAYAADGITDNVKALSSLLGSELASVPGEHFSYANDNYSILALIIESVSGETYEDFLRSEILLPAGMTHAGFWGDPADAETLIPPVITPLQQESLTPNWGFRGATGMHASVMDLFNWVLSLESEKILSRSSVRELMGNHVQLPSGTEVGFNWFAGHTNDGTRMYFSRGNESFGGNAVIYLYPERNLTVITATNAGPAELGNGPVEGWSRKAHKALAEIFLAE